MIEYLFNYKKNGNKRNHACGTSEFNVVSCSGASDLGQLSDTVARKLRDNKVRKMNCLSMIAIDNQPIITAFKSANVLVIDGCPVDCGKKILEKAGITKFNHLRLTDLGYKKGETPATNETVNEIYEKSAVIY